MARAPAASTPDGIAKRLKRAEAPTGWQKRLDKALLDVDISLEQRVRLLQKVAKDGKKVSSDVRVAVEEIREKGMGKGHPLVLDLLFPTGTTVRSDLEGLFALRKQVPEVLSSLEPPTLDAVQAATPPPDPFTVASQLASLATDEKKQKEVLQEVTNAVRSTPKGLETPRYKTLRTWPAGGALDGVVELRQYEPFTAVSKKMGGSGLGAPSDGGAGFMGLAEYLFGGNAEGEEMAMTMPVEISRQEGREATMSFVIPRAQAAAPPTPKTDDVVVEEVAARLVAVKPFSGIATEEEVARQVDALFAAIEADGGTRPLDARAHSVLQYNAPYTVPWRRRNEIAIVVEQMDEAAAENAENAEGGGVVSWYDAGVRL